MPEMLSPNTILRSSQLLSPLTDEELAEIIAATRTAQMQRGEIIWLEGEQVGFFGVLGAGFVKMVKSPSLGTEVTMEMMGPGQVFGMLGTIEGGGCPLSAVAVTDGCYAKVPKSVFAPIFQKSIAMKEHLLRRTTVRFKKSHDLMARMSSGRVDERIAAILFLLCESYGKQTSEGIRLEVPLTRQEIGEMAGTTVESTIRTLSRWQKEGLVRTENHHVVILDEDALDSILAR